MYDPDAYCSRHFRYRDLIDCGETLRVSQVDNPVKSPQTWEAIRQLATTILDPVEDEFGDITLTFGVCSSTLAGAIRKRARQEGLTPRIAPELDQHTGFEVNRTGKRICNQDGLACDFYCSNTPSDQVAAWIVSNCPFDKLFYYGRERPLHVSVGPEGRQRIVLVKRQGRLSIPTVITKTDFIQQLQTTVI